MKKAYAIIPARYASTRFPAKPLAEIGGKPLFWHVYRRACEADVFSSVWLATDDERIEEKAQSLGVPFVHTKKEHQSGTDRVREAVNILNLDEDAVIANIQGDEPFIRKAMLEKLLEPFENSHCGSATLGVVLDEEKDKERIFSPNQVKIALAQNGEALYFSRSPIPFARDSVRKAPYVGHVGVYAFKRVVLEKMAEFPPSPLEETEKLEQLRLLENGIRMHVRLISEAPHGVDTPADLDKALQYYQEHPEFWGN